MTIRDVRDVGKLATLALIAWLFPPRFWRKAAKATRLIGRTDHYSAAYQQILMHKYSKSEITRIRARHRIYLRELRLQILGLNGPWHSWHPDIQLIGTNHLRRALETGHGAILWVTETAFSTLIVKMALHRAGYQASQLSRPEHGFSVSRFGVRFLNPFWTRVENRFIAERVLIIGDYASDALSVLHTRLCANCVIIITVAPQAHKLAQVPLFHTQMRLPIGPIRLARMTGAALLPVFAIAKDEGRFEVAIQEPLRVTADNESAATDYAKRLEPFILKYPDQWNGWHSLQ